MADGKWVMTEEDSKRVDLTFAADRRQNLRDLPNFGQHKYVDERSSNIIRRCSFCGAEDMQSGFGGTTDFVCREEK